MRNPDPFSRKRKGSVSLLLLLTALLCGYPGADAQKAGADFRKPLDIPLSLSGNFGELRTNHFHTGLDIRTQGRTGLPVRASQKGYVSRIDVSPWGYGKALYIDHPNGYTTVYAHLSGFNDEIERFLKEAQYEHQTFSINIKPQKGHLPVEKGEVVAFSGNSGGTAGPHLHFEIRETDSEKPLNPMSFGLAPKDTRPPRIGGVRIFPFGDRARVNGKPTTAGFYVNGGNGKFRLRGRPRIRIHGKVGFGIRTIDRIDQSSFEYAIYSITLLHNEDTLYYQRMEKLDFAIGRYMNAHTDYRMLEKYDKPYHRSHVLPNNQQPVFNRIRNNGMVTFRKDTIHRFTYHVRDKAGNLSTLEFQVQGLSRAKPEQPPDILSKEVVKRFRYDRPNAFERAGISLSLPRQCLYQDLGFTFSERDTPRKCIAPKYMVHDPYTPVHRNYRMKVRTGRLPGKLREKALLVKLKDGPRKPMGGRYKKGWVQGKVRSFGDFSVALDTTAPKIVPLNISPGKNLKRQKTIRLKVSDDLSGVKTFNGSIDGEWVLMEYDPKAPSLTHDLSDRPREKGTHRFKLVVTDERGNTSTYEADLIW